jgi:hypothetical protein
MMSITVKIGKCDQKEKRAAKFSGIRWNRHTGNSSAGTFPCCLSKPADRDRVRFERTLESSYYIIVIATQFITAKLANTL